jgi:alcohol dehydrogenase
MLGADRDHPVPMDRVIANELEIRGSHGMQAHAFAPLLAMIADGAIDPGTLVRRRVNLKEGAHALMQMADHHQPGMTVIDRIA